jgi:hypothetical protein
MTKITTTQIREVDDDIIQQLARSTMTDGCCAGIFLALRVFYDGMTTGVIANKSSAFLYPGYPPCHLYHFIKSHSSKQDEYGRVQEMNHRCQWLPMPMPMPMGGRRRRRQRPRTLWMSLWVICGYIVYLQRMTRVSPRHSMSIARKRT